MATGSEDDGVAASIGEKPNRKRLLELSGVLLEPRDDRHLSVFTDNTSNKRHLLDTTGRPLAIYS